MAIDSSQPAEKKRKPLGLSAVRKKKKAENETPNVDSYESESAAVYSDCRQENREETQIMIPEGTDQIEELRELVQKALDSLAENDMDSGLSWYRAVVHECDRQGRESDEASISLPVEFYGIFGDALAALGSLEADANSSIYNEFPGLRQEHKQFFDAAIERYELGLEEYPNDIHLVHSLTLAQLRRQAILYDWYSKKDSWNPDEEFNGAIDNFIRILDSIPNNLERAEYLVSIGNGISEYAAFIRDSCRRNFFFEASVKVFNEAVRECLLDEDESDEQDKSASLAVKSLNGAGGVYLSWALEDSEGTVDGAIMKQRLLKAQKYFEKAVEIEKVSNIPLDAELLQNLAEVLINLGNYEEERQSIDGYYQAAVKLLKQCLEIDPDSLPESLIEFIKDVENGDIYLSDS